MSKISFSELLGFAGLDVDGNAFGDAFDSRVGAKVGKEPPGPSMTRSTDAPSEQADS